MIRAIKAVSSERGRDPREYALFAFGGNGPLFAGGMAEALGMQRVVVPPSAGLFSSFGLLYAEVEHHYSRTFRRLLRKVDLARARRGRGTRSREQARDAAAAEGFRRRASRSAARRPALPGPDLRADRARARRPDRRALVAHLEEAFGREHERTYGHRAGADEPVELVTIQVVGHGLREGPRMPRTRAPEPRRTASAAAAPRLFRRRGWLETPVMRRSDLSRAQRACSSSRNTTPPASCRPAGKPSSTTAATSS